MKCFGESRVGDGDKVKVSGWDRVALDGLAFGGGPVLRPASGAVDRRSTRTKITYPANASHTTPAIPIIPPTNDARVGRSPVIQRDRGITARGVNAVTAMTIPVG